MDFLQRNIFTLLRSQNFGINEEMEPMTTFKKNKIAQMMKNLDDIPRGEEQMNNRWLNHRFKKIVENEPHAMDTSMTTVDLLRIIVRNANCMLANGINLKGIIELGQFLRTRGDKVDFVKLDSWLFKLRIQRLAQLEGSVLIQFFEFEQDEIPFVRHVEPGAKRLTLRSLYYNIQEQEDITFGESSVGFVHVTVGKSLRRSMRYFSYAPVETASHFISKLFTSLSEIEE